MNVIKSDRILIPAFEKDNHIFYVAFLLIILVVSLELQRMHTEMN